MNNILSSKSSSIFKKNGHKQSNNQTGFLLDQENGLYVEDYFHEMLATERKRTERSHKPFILMLINIQELRQDKNEVTKNLVQALFSSTREIDIKGWYKINREIGIIFSEINGTGPESLRNKIYKGLCDILAPEHISKIKISTHIYPENNDKPDSGNTADIILYPDLTKQNKNKNISFFTKRVIDILGGLVGLIIFSPFFITMPFLIKITSRGPVFFKQKRVGQLGNIFTFLKFRTMHVNNDAVIHQEYIKKFIREQKSYDSKNSGEKQECTYKIKNDPRVTPIGNFLRKTSIDELPQFINVLKGEMSLVGPRPPIPYEIENYATWHKRRITEVKPGITGLWQVMGRSSTTFDEMVRLDLRYVRNWSLWLDIKIIIKTPWVLLTGKGAY